MDKIKQTTPKHEADERYWNNSDKNFIINPLLPKSDL